MEAKSAVTSLTIHAGALLLLLGITVLTSPLLKLADVKDLPPRPIKLLRYRTTAGGSSAIHLPASAGHPPPRIEARIFVPPQAMVLNPAPKLIMTAAMDVPPFINTSIGPIGDPSGLGKILSGGMGGTGGIGDGTGHSIGPGGTTGVYQPGRGGVTAPVVVRKVEPEYSEEARKARATGTVLVFVEIGPDGRVHNARIARGVGLGLDEKAVESVSQWVFRPGTKDGRPVTVSAQIEVAFHLL